MGGCPFSFFPNTTSILTDPTLLSDQKSIFGSGSFSNKFGINDLYESSFITGTRFKKYGVGLGFTRFGNFIYKESQVAVLSSRRIRDNIIFGGGIMVYNIAIKEYGAASTIGTRLSLRYQMNASLQSVFSLLNANQPQIGKSKEPLPQVISGGILLSPTKSVHGQLLILHDISYPISIRLGISWQPINEIGFAVGKTTDPDIFTAGGFIKWKYFQFEFGCLSYTNVGFVTYQVGFSIFRLP